MFFKDVFQRCFSNALPALILITLSLAVFTITCNISEPSTYIKLRLTLDENQDTVSFGSQVKFTLTITSPEYIEDIRIYSKNNDFDSTFPVFPDIPTQHQFTINCIKDGIDTLFTTGKIIDEDIIVVKHSLPIFILPPPDTINFDSIPNPLFTTTTNTDTLLFIVSAKSKSPLNFWVNSTPPLDTNSLKLEQKNDTVRVLVSSDTAQIYTLTLHAQKDAVLSDSAVVKVSVYEPLTFTTSLLPDSIPLYNTDTLKFTLPVRTIDTLTCSLQNNTDFAENELLVIQPNVQNNNVLSIVFTPQKKEKKETIKEKREFILVLTNGYLSNTFSYEIPVSDPIPLWNISQNTVTAHESKEVSVDLKPFINAAFPGTAVLSCNIGIITGNTWKWTPPWGSESSITAAIWGTWHTGVHQLLLNITVKETDTISPAITFAAPTAVNTIVGDSSVIINATVKDPLSGVSSVKLSYESKTIDMVPKTIGDSVYTAVANGLKHNHKTEMKITAQDCSMRKNSSVQSFHITYNYTIKDTASPIFSHEYSSGTMRTSSGQIDMAFLVTDTFSGVDSVYWTLNGTSKGLLSQNNNTYTLLSSLSNYGINTIKVFAIDKSLNRNRDSVTFVYDYNTEITDITLISPTNGQSGIDTNISIAFKWSGGKDADNDTVFSEIRYGLNENALTKSIAGKNCTTLVLTEKTKSFTDYYWQTVVYSKTYPDTIKSSVYKFKTKSVLPVITTQLNAGTAKTDSILWGEKVTLKVKATGTPAPSYKWRKNGLTINNTADSLLINSADMTHSGAYFVEISNVGGTVTSNSIILNVLPAKLWKITEKAVNATENTEVSVDLRPFINKIFPQAVTFTSDIGTINEADSTWSWTPQWGCEPTVTAAVLGTCDSKEYSLRLAITVAQNDTIKPVIAPVLEDKIINTANYTFDITVTDIGAGVSSVKMIYNSDTVSMTKKPDIENGYTGTIVNLTNKQKTEIRITAQDNSQKKNSSESKFFVTYNFTDNDNTKPAITKTDGPNTGSRITDGKVKLSFKVTDNSGVDSVYWTLNGTSKGLLSQNGNTYTIFDILTVYGANTIKVFAVDKSLSKNRDSVTFVYNYNTEITGIVLVSPVNNAVNTDTASVTFTWTGGTDADRDEVTYELHYGTEQNNLATKITGITSPYAFTPDTKLSAYTDYYWQITAKNTSENAFSGTASSSVYKFKTKARPPVITTQLNAGTAKTDSILWGEKVTLKVKATGTPAPSYKWKKNGLIINNTADSLLINSAADTNSGTYIVEISNDGGTVTSSSIILKVLPAKLWEITEKAVTATENTKISVDLRPFINTIFPRAVTFTSNLGTVNAADSTWSWTPPWGCVSPTIVKIGIEGSNRHKLPLTVTVNPNDNTAPVITEHSDKTIAVSNYTVDIAVTDVGAGVSSVTLFYGANTVAMTKKTGIENTYTAEITGLVNKQKTEIRIAAQDGSQKKNLSESKFYVTYDNTVEDNTKPAISKTEGPNTGSRITDGKVKLSFKVTDNSGIDSVYWTHNDTAKGLLSQNGNNYTLSGSLGRYGLDTIKVFAVDKSLSKNRDSVTFVYNYNTEITDIVLVSPVNNAVNTDTASVTFTWTGGIDADRDEVTYDLHYGTDQNNLATKITGITLPYAFTPDTKLSAYTDYYWQITAKNTSENAYSGTASSSVYKFKTKARPPVITTQLNADAAKTDSIYTGQKVVLTVEATGIPAPSYKWRKNGLTIENTANTLVINSAASTNSGAYFVEISNDGGTVTSSSIILNVLPEETVTFSHVPNTVYTINGSTDTLLFIANSNLKKELTFEVTSAPEISSDKLKIVPKKDTARVVVSTSEATTYDITLKATSSTGKNNSKTVQVVSYNPLAFANVVIPTEIPQYSTNTLKFTLPERPNDTLTCELLNETDFAANEISITQPTAENSNTLSIAFTPQNKGTRKFILRLKNSHFKKVFTYSVNAIAPVKLWKITEKAVTATENTAISVDLREYINEAFPQTVTLTSDIGTINAANSTWSWTPPWGCVSPTIVKIGIDGSNRHKLPLTVTVNPNDIDAPVITEHSDVTIAVSNYTVDIAVTDDGAGVSSVKLFYGANTVAMTKKTGIENTYTAEITGLVNKQKTEIKIAAQDNSQKKNLSESKFYVTYDNTFGDKTKPAITKTGGPETNSRITDGKVQLTFTVTDISGIESVSWTLNDVEMGLLAQNGDTYTLFGTLTKFGRNTIKVSAVDKSLNKNESDMTFVYDYNTEITDIVLTSPDKNITDVDVFTITFEWTGGTDADGDEVTYELRYGTSQNILATTITEITSPYVFTPASILSTNTDYYWQIAAKSASGSTYSETNSPIYKFKTKIFDLDDGIWDETRISNVIASTRNNGTCAFRGNLTADILGYMKTAVKGRSAYIALDLSRCTGLDALPRYAFFWCSYLTSISIPVGVKTIEAYAFNYCRGLTSINIPSSVTAIGENAFDYCTGLSSITIPEGVETIGENAFYGCHKLTSINIPSSVTTIDGSAFRDCSRLIEIKVNTDNENYKDINGILFSKDEKALIRYPGGKNGTFYEIPSSVTTIGNWAFADCTGLSSITIPEGVKTIGNTAFYGCSGLTSINIPEGVTTIGDAAFSGCRGLTSINIPEGVKTIGNTAFYGCSGLTSINIPEGVMFIEGNTFDGCTELTSITIPSSVTTIRYGAFKDCNGLTTVNYTGTETQWNGISIGSNNNPLISAKLNCNYGS